MAPPPRTQTGDYHYHVFDYLGAQAWQTQNVGRDGAPTYSLAKDLKALADYGTKKKIPRMALENLGVITVDGNTTRTLALRFGGVNKSKFNYPIVVMTGGVHAREWIAPELVYLIAEYLVMHYAAKGTKRCVGYAKALSQLIDGRHLIFIPLLNPAGNRFTVFGPNAGDRMWRKNRRALPTLTANWSTPLTAQGAPFQNFVANPPSAFSYDVPVYGTNPLQYDTQAVNLLPQITGVDINRNYDTPAWGHIADRPRPESDPHDEAYFGPERESERETQNVAGRMTKNVAASIDYHAFARAILYSTEPGAITPRQRDLGLCLQRLIATGSGWSFSYDYKLGTTLSLLKYDAVGTGADYMASRKNSAAVTVELDPGKGEDPGFELPPDRIKGVFEKNIRGALGFIAGASGNLTLTTGGYVYRHNIQSAAVSQFLNWNVWGRGNQLPA